MHVDEVWITTSAHAKEPCITTKELQIVSKEPCFTAKSPTSMPKSTVSTPRMHIDEVWRCDVQHCNNERNSHVHASSYCYNRKFYMGQQVH